MKETVNIVPVGWEVDRVIEAAKMRKADRVILLRRDTGTESARFFQKIAKGLEASRIEWEDEVVGLDNEFQDTLRAVAHCVRREHHKKHRVEVNISAGGKTAAVAASLAAMYHQGRCTLFQAIPESYTASKLEQGAEAAAKLYENHGLTIGVKDVPDLTHYHLTALPLEQEIVLAACTTKQQTLDDLLNLLRKHGSTSFRLKLGKDRDAAVKVLERWVLQDLEEKKYVERDQHLGSKGNRKSFLVTDVGLDAALITGLLNKERTPQFDLA